MIECVLFMSFNKWNTVPPFELKLKTKYSEKQNMANNNYRIANN